ncbi:hypothetical protein GCM10027615_26510 [Plantactinospora veratri]
MFNAPQTHLEGGIAVVPDPVKPNGDSRGGLTGIFVSADSPMAQGGHAWISWSRVETSRCRIITECT